MNANSQPSVDSIYQFEAERLEGGIEHLSDYRGQVLLIVNTASKCGFTPQFDGLEQLYQRYHTEGFTILGFPCNQFGGQDPGTAQEIGEFCQRNYGVNFPMFAKVDVKGKAAHPLFRYLTAHTKGVLFDDIKWNFTKFLIGRDGQVIGRYGSMTKPESLAADIEQALAQRVNSTLDTAQ